MLTLLHTSDWHLGRSLFKRKRYDEFAAFLDWLAETLQQKSVDILVIAGDIFDTTAPTNRAQALYYRFLCRVAAGAICRHVVVVAGNHDSPSFLDAPRELLNVLDVHVIGHKRDDPADEVLVLKDADGAPEAIVCAVPYLRDRDLRNVEAGESVADKEMKLLAGLHAHYAAVAAIAEEKRGDLDIPIIATGHLFTDGGKTQDGDGVRELYVGSLAHVPLDLFPANLDYLALGHLHLPQTVRACAHIRYSGAPLAMGFSEAGQQKSVCCVEFHGKAPTVECLPVPLFQSLVCIKGDKAQIAQQVGELKSATPADIPVWLEITYTGEEAIGDLRARLATTIEGTALDILRFRNPARARLLAAQQTDETLEDLAPEEVFTRCLEANLIPEADRAELRRTYNEIWLSIQEADNLAE
jgi:exonuclease SbcD